MQAIPGLDDGQCQAISQILGLNLNEAKSIANQQGFSTLRIFAGPGTVQIVTFDYRTERLNIELDKNNIVTKIVSVG